MERNPDGYARAARRSQRLMSRNRRFIGIIAAARLLSFCAAAIFGFAAWYDAMPWTYGPLALLGGVGFIVAVLLHRRPYAAAPRLAAAAAINQESACRLSGEWDRLPDDGRRYLGDSKIDEPRLGELQIFGRGSLYQTLCRASLPGARDAVARALRDGASAHEVKRRQQAGAELARKTRLWRRLEIEGRVVNERDPTTGLKAGLATHPATGPRIERFLEWAESRSEPRYLVAAVWLARVLVPLTWTQCVLTGFFDIPTAWAAGIALQTLLFVATTFPLSRCYDTLVGSEPFRPFIALRRMFELVERAHFKAPALVELQQAMRAHPEGRAGAGAWPSAAMGELEAIAEALAARQNALMFLIANILGLWEIFYVGRLARWRRRYGHRVREDLARLSEFEALCSIGAFAHDHPGYIWPTVWSSEQNPGSPVFDGRGLGHPLIPASQRRCNDFSLDSGGRVVLITGSNMSGKSSFLRTVGVSVVLAQAGAPVCATALSLQVCELSTSIQVTDLPEQGLSRFYAEVKRIRRILDEVAAAEANRDLSPRLFLVDEMLSGTNSRERNLASQAVARALVAAGRSYGLVTTHDLSLVSLVEAFSGRVETYHFTDRVDGNALCFDYRLRPGVASTTNALDILRMEGIEV